MEAQHPPSIHSGDAKTKPRESRVMCCPRCGSSFPIVPAPPREGYYVRARAWCAASPLARVKLSANRARDFACIKRLGDVWGVRLDELGASYRMVRWCGSPRYLADREARYRRLVALLEEHGTKPDIGRRFDELQDSMPKVGRWAER